MEKTKIATWLLDRIGTKANEIQNGCLDDSALEMIGDDIHSYVGMLKDLIINIILPL